LDTFLRRSFEEARRLTAEEVELWTLYDQPREPRMFSGHDGLRRWFERLEQLWAYTEVLGVQVDERFGGWVLMRVDARVRGRGSPHEFELRVWVAIEVADDLITKFGLFPERAGAVGMIDAG
jgi:hypothetical protein